jgi:hypothetical protein
LLLEACRQRFTDHAILRQPHQRRRALLEGIVAELIEDVVDEDLSLVVFEGILSGQGHMSFQGRDFQTSRDWHYHTLNL